MLYWLTVLERCRGLSVPRSPLPIDTIKIRDGAPDLLEVSKFDESGLVYDPSTLAELESVFGRVRLMDLLSHLKSEIAQRLLAPETDRSALRHDAHTLLSVSGSLGFFELSRRCIEMEQACLLGIDLVAPLRAARSAAKGAIAAIGELEACAIAATTEACAA